MLLPTDKGPEHCSLPIKELSTAPYLPLLPTDKRHGWTLLPTNRGHQRCYLLIKDISTTPYWQRTSALLPTDKGHQRCSLLIKDISAAPYWERKQALLPTDKGHERRSLLIKDISAAPCHLQSWLHLTVLLLLSKHITSTSQTVQEQYQPDGWETIRAISQAT